MYVPKSILPTKGKVSNAIMDVKNLIKIAYDCHKLSVLLQSQLEEVQKQNNDEDSEP